MPALICVGCGLKESVFLLSVTVGLVFAVESEEEKRRRKRKRKRDKVNVISLGKSFLESLLCFCA